MKQIAMLLALVAISPWAFGQAYRCTDGEGRVTFSQYPCGAEAEAVRIDPRSRGIGVAPGGDWSATREANDRREVARELERHQRILRRLMIQRDERIADLRRRQGQARNNQAGAVYRQSLAMEIQAVAGDYNSRIRYQRDLLRELRRR